MVSVPTSASQSNPVAPMKRTTFVFANAAMAALLGYGVNLFTGVLDLSDPEDSELYWTMLLLAAVSAGLSAFFFSNGAQPYRARRLLQAVVICVAAYMLYSALLVVWGMLFGTLDLPGALTVAGFSLQYTGLPALVFEYIVLYVAERPRPTPARDPA